MHILLLYEWRLTLSLVLNAFGNDIQIQYIILQRVWCPFTVTFLGGIVGDGGRPAAGPGADGVEQTPERRPEQAGEVCDGAAER